MAELASQQSSSTIYRLTSELGAYRLREALADKPFIEYDKTEPGELLQWPLPGDPVASITVASAVDGSQATMYLRNDAMVLDNAPKTFPWLKRCGLEPGWSRPYTDPKTQSVVISFVAPLVRDGKVVAAVAAGAVPVGARASKKRPAAPAFLAVTEPRLRSRLLYPNPVCLLTTWGEVDGSWRKNVMTISWLTCLNNDADVLLSINARRHSAAAVLSGRAFGLSVPTADLAAMVLKIGACSGSKHDKLATVEGLAAVEADDTKAGKGGFAALMSDSSDDDDGVAAPPPDTPWYVEGCVARLACVVSRRLTEGEDLCANRIYGAFVLNRRVDLHAIDATPARWRGDVGSSPLDGPSAATSSPRNDLVHPTHWLISTQARTTTSSSQRSRTRPCARTTGTARPSARPTAGRRSYRSSGRRASGTRFNHKNLFARLFEPPVQVRQVDVVITIRLVGRDRASWCE